MTKFVPLLGAIVITAPLIALAVCVQGTVLLCVLPIISAISNLGWMAFCIDHGWLDWL